MLGIVYLGDDTDGGVISTKSRRLFLSKFSSSSTADKPEQAWNLNKTQVEVLIWGNGPFAVHESSSLLGEDHKCLLKGRHAYSATYSFPLKSRSNVTLKLSQESCTNPHKWNSKQLTPLRSEPSQLISPLNDNQEFQCIPINGSFNESLRSKSYKRNIDNINFLEYSRTKDLLTPIDSAKINEQTERLARKLIAHVFLEEPLPDMNFVEWKFLMIAEEIFDIACPTEMVPKAFFEYMLVFYRFILLESFDKFPPETQRDDETIVRIEAGLDSCLAHAKPFVFHGFDNCSLAVSKFLFPIYD